jgi:hypothetical protein
MKIPLGDHIDLVFPILYPSTVAARTGGCLEQYARSVKLVPCTEQYWEFVRALRMDERVAEGFIEKADITPGGNIAFIMSSQFHDGNSCRNSEPSTSTISRSFTGPQLRLHPLDKLRNEFF